MVFQKEAKVKPKLDRVAKENTLEEIMLRRGRGKATNSRQENIKGMTLTFVTTVIHFEFGKGPFPFFFNATHHFE